MWYWIFEDLDPAVRTDHEDTEDISQYIDFALWICLVFAIVYYSWRLAMKIWKTGIIPVSTITLLTTNEEKKQMFFFSLIQTGTSSSSRHLATHADRIEHLHRFDLLCTIHTEPPVLCSGSTPELADLSRSTQPYVDWLRGVRAMGHHSHTYRLVLVPTSKSKTYEI